MRSGLPPIVAREIQCTERALIVVTGQARMEILWEKCSERLAQATTAERSVARLSPSRSSIYWPLIDEDLAVGPLVMGR